MDKSFNNLRRIVFFAMVLAIAFSINSLDAKASMDYHGGNHTFQCRYWFEDYGTFPTYFTTNINENYSSGIYKTHHAYDREERCSACHQVVKSVTLAYEEHSFAIRSMDNYGGMDIHCMKCNYCFDDYYYLSIENYISQSDKKVYVSLKPIKGSVITLQIGSKKYYKAMTQTIDTRVTYAFNIKKPKKGQKIKMYLTLGGQTVQCFPNIGSATNEKQVLISRNPKKGMTKKQVKNYTAFGTPDDIYKYSGGYESWSQNDGSYVIFKKGKVYRWSMKK